MPETAEHVETIEAPAPAPAIVGGPPQVAESPVLALQRTAGNRAVLALLARSAPEQTLQRRRVASPLDIMDLASNPAGPDAAAHQRGIERMIRRAWDELSDEEKDQVRRARLHGLTSTQFNALSANEQSIWWAQAIRNVRPGLEDNSPTQVRAAWDQMSAPRRDAARRRAMHGLTPSAFAALTAAEKNARWAEAIRGVWGGLTMGDPTLIDVGPRPGTSEPANLQRLVDNANRVFDEIQTAAQTANLRQVFGASHVAAARLKYRRAKTRMNFLHTHHRIVTDRSGYNFEVSLGGLTNSEQLAIAPEVMDNPNDVESIVIMIHESMHAGNDSVTDLGYIDIDADTFKGLPAATKLNNAAHFEVTPRRMLGAAFQFAGETFTPAGSSSSAPALTPRQQAVRGASEMFREAWTLGLNLHVLWVRLYRNPSEWNTFDVSSEFGGVTHGLHWSDTLPFWSKVEKLTVHERTHINPTAGNVATSPVTLVDIALSEGLTRKLSEGMSAVPEDEAAATAFLNAKATAAERAAATTVPQERDLLIRLALRERVHSITGSTDRDFRVVTMMGTNMDTFGQILQRRSPADFAD